VTTSTSVVKNSHLSTPTRFAMFLSQPILESQDPFVPIASSRHD
jgi:hypothetical protein